MPIAATLVLISLAGLQLEFASAAAPPRPVFTRELARQIRAVAALAHTPAAPAPSTAWVSTWGASPQPAVTHNRSAAGFDDETLRELVFTSVGGRYVRVRFTNAFGTTPLAIDRALVGIQSKGAAIVHGTNHPLTFAGQSSIEIPPGAEALSDPLKLTVKPLQRLAISLHLPGPTGPATQHGVAQQTGYVAAGDRARTTAAAPFKGKTHSWFFIDAVDVVPVRDTLGAIVALGDSITDGVGSTFDANARWPNDLARRLNAEPGPTMSVIDEGIGGNRVLNDAPCCGVNAVARFQRDVAARAGVREVILLEGVNDIGYSTHTGPFTAPHTNVNATQIIAGDEQIIAQAHAAGLKIFGGTLTPFKGARYWTPAGEAKREALNDWIRTGDAFDGVIDFAAVLADKADPDRINPLYASSDHLHPNSAGYRAMARAIDLAALLRAA